VQTHASVPTSDPILLRHDANDIATLTLNRPQHYNALSSALLIEMQAAVDAVARAHGIVAAAGCQLVAQCDLAVAASDARFATSGINVGLFCATPSEGK